MSSKVTKTGFQKRFPKGPSGGHLSSRLPKPFEVDFQAVFVGVPIVGNPTFRRVLQLSSFGRQSFFSKHGAQLQVPSTFPKRGLCVSRTGEGDLSRTGENLGRETPLWAAQDPTGTPGVSGS